MLPLRSRLHIVHILNVLLKIVTISDQENMLEKSIMSNARSIIQIMMTMKQLPRIQINQNV